VNGPSGGSFDNLVFSVPQRTADVASDDASAFDLFRQAPDPSKPEPVTQPMAVVPISSPAAAASAVPAEQGAVGERTLTRREMRAMLQAQEANQQANHSPATVDPVFPVTFTHDADGLASDASATPAPAPAAPAADTGVTSSPVSAFTVFGTAAASAAPQTAAQPQPVPAADDSAAGDSAAGDSAAGDSAEDDAELASQERRPFTPPTGHWSTAAELEDGAEPITTRNVTHSTAATTTNALILPSLPQADATGPLTSTGEILVTGSIDLPRSIGATGAHDRIDSSDIDRLLDGEENEFNTSEVAPVRASRAISTHTSTRGVIAPPKKRGNTLPVVLMVTAGVLAIGVIGLLIAAYVLHIF
jgi:hypothetical protein